MVRNGHERIVAAGDEQTARLIADAMLGEEVAAHEHLAVVEVVEKTDKPATLNCWTTDQELAIWEKVMKRVGLAEDDVIFIYDSYSKKSRPIGMRITNLAKLTNPTTKSF